MHADVSTTDMFAFGRLKRALAGSCRRWAQAIAELHASSWRSSFPIDAKRGWAADEGGGGGESPSRSAASSAQTLSAQPTPSIGRALLPLGVGGVAVAVYDDEPTSVIAYALASAQYAQLLAAARTSASAARPVVPAPTGREALGALASTGVNWPTVASPEAAHVRCAFDEPGGGTWGSGGAGEAGQAAALLPHPPAPAARFQVTQYFAPQFEALCCLWGLSSSELLRTLSRCARWESSGGKSGAYFAKTRDDAFIVKGLSRPELASVLEFAPAYAAYAAAAAAADRAVLLAKLVGVFSVHVAVAGRRDMKLDLVVMQNLFPGGGHLPVFDLKGVAGRARAAPDDAPVLLDENLVERAAVMDAPLVISQAYAAKLSMAVRRDTAFLARLGVMDYSLVAGLREGSLSVGVVDYLRQYTWDKQLETYVKSSAVLALTSGGEKPQQPTVISPKEYARRFRIAMRTYFVISPIALQSGLRHPAREIETWIQIQGIGHQQADAILIGVAIQVGVVSLAIGEQPSGGRLGDGVDHHGWVAPPGRRSETCFPFEIEVGKSC
jgi:1-phosphatidylinositol-3-phosphate 5-kinase